MSSGVPVLPALGPMDGSQRLQPCKVKQLQPRALLHQLAPPHTVSSKSPQTLPPISTLAGPSRSPNGSPASLASSEEFGNQEGTSASEQSVDTSNYLIHHDVLLRKRGSEASDEVIETMETDEDGLLGAPHKSSGHPRMPMGVPSPTWTTRWITRAPPPRPLNTTSAARSVMFPNSTLPSVMAPPIGRHHPYASRGNNFVIPSPTWPAHIGLDDSCAPSQQTSHARLSPPRHAEKTVETAYRRRASTLTSSVEDHRLPGSQRPPPSRGNFYLTPVLNQRASMESLGQQRRYGRGYNSSSNEFHSASYPSPALPPSPLLFTPLSPWSAVDPSHYSPSALYNQSHSPGATDQRNMYAHYGADGQRGHHNMLQLSLYDQQQQPQQQEPSRRGVCHTSAISPSLPGKQFPSQHAQDQGTPPPPLGRFSQSRRRRRPPYSYSSLIAQAITSSSENRMTLREIYTWISNAYPELYSMDGPDSQGWQNTVRHNLSLNRTFVKVARTAQDIYDSCVSSDPAHSQAARGKGGWWTIDASSAASKALLATAGGADTSPLPGRSPNGFSADEEYFPSSGRAAKSSNEGPDTNTSRRSSVQIASRSMPMTSGDKTSVSASSDPLPSNTRQLPSVLRPLQDVGCTDSQAPLPTVIVGLGFDSADSSTRRRAVSKPYPLRLPCSPPSPPSPPRTAPGIRTRSFHGGGLPQRDHRTVSSPARTHESSPRLDCSSDADASKEEKSGRTMAISGLLC